METGETVYVSRESEEKARLWKNKAVYLEKREVDDSLHWVWRGERLGCCLVYAVPIEPEGKP